MCWQYDIEMKPAASAEANVLEVSVAPATALVAESIRLTDVELLVGNLYAARCTTAKKELPGNP